MKNVIRIVAIVAIAAAAMFGAFSAADAQYTPADPTPAEPELRGSSFEPDPATANTGKLGFSSVNAVAGSGAAAGGVGGTGGGTTGGLAITGSETDLPLAIGISLLALGGTAVVASRKRD